MPDISARITREYPKLTKAHQTTANYVADHFQNVAFDTLEYTAEQIGVSTATVVRFSHILGYNGYTDMQREIQKDVKDQITLPEKFNSALNINSDELYFKSFRKDMANINQTMLELSPEQLKGAAALIKDAKNIYILGMRESYSLAHYMHSRLFHLKPNVRLLDPTANLMPDGILFAQEGDLCIAYAFPRYSRVSIEMLQELKRKKVSILLITAPNYNQISHLGDIILPCHVRGISYKTSSAAPICLSNYLANAVASIEQERSLALFSEMEDIFTRSSQLW